MNAIDRAPDALSRAGQDFSYAVWTANTRVTLHAVPWSADYRDIVDFPNQAALDAYLLSGPSPHIEITRAQYLKPDEPITLDIPFNTALQYNYLRVENPTMPVKGDRKLIYYYFIGDMKFVAPNTTQMAVMLDVWETFRWGITIGNCYVERGHVGIADSNAYSNNGRDVLLQPEGMDFGNEYTTVAAESLHIANTGDAQFVIMSNIELTGDYGTQQDPHLQTAWGTTAENLPNGMSMYLFTHRDDLLKYLQAAAAAPWVTQGIVSITAVPADVEFTTTPNTYTIGGNSGGILSVTGIKTTTVQTAVYGLTKLLQKTVLGTGRYRNLSKFLTAPYTIIEATTNSGTPLIIKPECVGNKDLRFLKMVHMAPPGPRISFGLLDYNTDSRGVYRPLKSNDPIQANTYPNDWETGSAFDMQTGIFDLPQFSTVNNSYVNFMASNAHGLAYQHQSADWSQQKALQGNQLAFNQTTAGMNLASTLNNNNNQTAGIQAGINVGTQALGAMATGGLTAGNAIGAVGQLAGTGVSNWNNTRNTNATNANTAYMRDTNKQFADFAARGDYANAIAGIQAKCQDAKLMQPSTVGQVGGDAFMLAVNRWALIVKVKTLQMGAMSSIGEYWLRYGYAINRFHDFSNRRFSVMSKFTYWKVAETYITKSDIPEPFKNAIRGILEKGVTVWTDPSYIGSVDIADNDPIPGSYLKVGIQ